MHKLTVFYTFLLVFGSIWNLNAQFCNPIDTMVVIQDNQSTTIQITVEGVNNNDLSNNLQGLCAIQLGFEHSQVGDLTIHLTSPAGQQITLVGPYLVNFPTPFSGWSVTFTQCGFPSSPDPGFPSVWTNEASWAAFGSYTGTYYPNDGCLEDFNIGPVNGTWTITITDHILFDEGLLDNINLIFCDPDGIDCGLCDADAGIIDMEDLAFCLGDPLLDLDLPNIIIDTIDEENYGYSFFRIFNDTIDNLDDPLDLSVVDTGLYQICGISYHLNDSAYWQQVQVGMAYSELLNLVESPTSVFCSDLSENCIEIRVLPSPEQLDTTILFCEGDTLFYNDSFFTNEGDYFIIDDSDGPCSKTTLLHARYYDIGSSIISDGFILNCNQNSIRLEGIIESPYPEVSFTWITDGGSFLGSNDSLVVSVSQPGIYSLITEKFGCSDTTSVTIISDGSIPQYLLAGGTIDCNNPEIVLNLIPLSPVSQIKWTTPTGSELFEEDPLIDIPGEYLLEITGTDGCISLGSISIDIDTIKPEINLFADTISCKDPSTEIIFETEDVLIDIFWPGLGTHIPNPILNATGTYYVESTGLNGCVSIDSIQIIGDFIYPDFIVSSDTITCIRDSVLLDVHVEGDNLVYQWIDPMGNTHFEEDLWAFEEGNYYLAVTNIHECTRDSFITVVEDLAEPEFTVPDTIVIPCDKDSIMLSASIITDYASFLWTGPGNFSSMEINPFIHVSGAYILELTGHNGCTQRDTTIVSAPPEITAVSFLIDTINCQNNTGRIEVVYAGNLTFSWEDELNNNYIGPVINSSVPGNYKLTITDVSFNCTNEMFVNLPLDTIPPVIDLNVPDTLNCLDPEVTLLVTSENSIKQVNWTGPGLISNANPVLVSSPGLYYVEVTGSNQCTSKDSVLVFQNDSFISVPDTFYLDCVADSIQISIPDIPVDFYEWYFNGELIGTVEAPYVYAAGEYKIVVSTVDGCIDSTIVPVFYDQELPQFELSLEGEFNCVDTFAVLQASLISAITDFEWTGPSFYSTDLTDSIFSTGTYYFHAIGENMCETTDSIKVESNIYFPIIEAIGDSVNCNNQNEVLSISAEITGEYLSVNWQGPDFFFSNSPYNVVQDTGQYFLQVEGSKGCYSYDTAYVLIDTFPPEFQFIRPDTITCFVNEVMLDYAEIDNITSNIWTGNNNFISFEKSVLVDQAGTYWLLVEGENGCINTGTVHVPQNKLVPYLDVESLDISCNRVKVPLILSTSSSNFFAEWTGPGNFEYTGPNPAVKDTGTYYVVITDLNNGCQNTDSVHVGADLEPPVVNTDTLHLSCNGDPVKLVVEVIPKDVDYFWTGPDDFQSFDAVPEVTEAGTYYIRVTRNDNGCSAFDSLFVSPIMIYPEIDLSFEPFNCRRDSTMLSVNQIENIALITWNGPSDFQADILNPVVYEPGDYTVKITGINGCEADSSFYIPIDTIKPVVNIQYEDYLICEKTQALLFSEGSDIGNMFDYEWSSGNGTILSGRYSVSPLIQGSGTYYLTITSLINNCVNTDSILVSERPSSLDSISFTVIEPSCFDHYDGRIIIDSVFEGVEPVKIALDDAIPLGVKTFNDLYAGNYLLSVTDANGCQLDTMVTLPEGPKIELELNADRELINLGESSNISASINASNPLEIIEWEPLELIELPNNLEITVSPTKTTTFSLFVEDSAGCRGEDAITISVIEEPELFIPNIFTPNGDSVNDIFNIEMGSGVESIELIEIYDRWGNKVYHSSNIQSTDPEFGWDGFYNGVKAQQGVYVYRIVVQTTGNKRIQITGDLTLIY